MGALLGATAVGFAVGIIVGGVIMAAVAVAGCGSCKERNKNGGSDI